MQHLRQVGVQEEGVDSILIEAPPASRNLSRKTLKGDAMLFRDISAEGLPPAELPATYESQEAIPSSLVGLQPNMNLHLRQTLEALDDDAFVDDELEDDFFKQLVADGERGDDHVEFEFHDDPDSVSDAPDAEGVQVNEESWEVRFQKFKNGMNAVPAPSDGASDLGDGSEGRDTVGVLPKLPVIGGKRRRKGMSDASGYSMSSSSLSRTELLQTLDERFDQASLLGTFN
jgi:protein LTV1